MISPAEFEQFKQWQAERQRPAVLDLFAGIRAILAAEGAQGIDLPARSTRHNPMVDDPDYWQAPEEGQAPERKGNASARSV